ncbi:2-haloacid dehalogenase [Mycolicibacterium rutilum]|uniref:2-haloacid dehalogenase n=1 Tax=Mycolicibacterium rutilum TaxID=370526 RepID=A0A1H6IQP6_MYCRU|nr:haloacid dehalogenase type II [Mycolicibacterium rutilum]SEH51496.1 2-haloacid dehalogenase [Mycolicibacterium rutilum]
MTHLEPVWPPTVLVFDVNETLLDLEVLAPLFERVLGDGPVLRDWFTNLVLYSMTLTVAGTYLDYFSLGQSVLTMLAEVRGREVSDDDRESLAEAMRTMPAHPDVVPGLQRLSGQGYHLAALTNSPIRAGASPLDNAGLSRFFERQVSVDASRVFKPSPELYRDVAQQMGVEPARCMMVATHAWDVIGAQSAGLSGALLTRPGHAPLRGGSSVPEPTVVCADLEELATQLERR